MASESSASNAQPLNLREWVKNLPLSSLLIEGGSGSSPSQKKPTISLQKSARRKLKRRHHSMATNGSSAANNKTNESASQTNKHSDEISISVDPLPNIKFTKRKMRIDHVIK